MKASDVAVASHKPPRAPRRSRTSPDQEKVVYVQDGRFTRSADVIPGSSQNLIVTVGRLETGDPVLLPYVEFGLERAIDSSDGERRPPWAATIAIDNASFLIMDVCRDFARISDELAGFCSERCGLDASRAEYILDCLTQAREAIDKGRASFENVRSQRGHS